MKPCKPSSVQPSLISLRARSPLLAPRHSLQHSSGVQTQVLQRYEWLVFVSAKLRPDLTWPRPVFSEGVYFGLPHVEL